MPRTKIKPVAKTSSGTRRRGGTGMPTNFTNAEAIKNNFLAHTSIRQAQKVSNDGTYWTGGRCQWGGSHNLLQDCQVLTDFANSVASVDSDIQELNLAANEQEFNSSKQQLSRKLQECVNKCQVTSSTSIGGICIIWDDFFGSFVKGWLGGFQGQLQAQLNQLQNTTPANQKEILQLEAEIKAAEAKYNEAMTNAAKETDPAKKAQFIAVANAAEKEVKRIKQKIARNPLSRLAEYNHLHNLGNLIRGNLPSVPTAPRNNPYPTDPTTPRNPTNLPNPSNPWTPWGGTSDPTNPQSTNQTQLLIFAGIAILAIFFIMNQKEHE